MKCLFSVILSFFFLATAQANPPHGRASDGGMSGGGGKVIPSEKTVIPQDPEIVEQQVKIAYSTAVSYLGKFQTDYKSKALVGERAALAFKAFDRGDDMLALSKSVRPNIKDSSPCLDFDGNNVDGSIRSDQPNTFCISAFTIANKVHSSEVSAQSAALMIHEVSEFAGFSEDEAKEFQLQVYQDMLK